MLLRITTSCSRTERLVSGWPLAIRSAWEHGAPRSLSGACLGEEGKPGLTLARLASLQVPMLMAVRDGVVVAPCLELRGWLLPGCLGTVSLAPGLVLEVPKPLFELAIRHDIRLIIIIFKMV